GEAAMTDGRGARGDRRIEGVDIDRDVAPLAVWNVAERRLGALGPHLAQRGDIRAIGPRGLEIPAAHRRHVVRPERGDSLDMRHFGSPAHRAAVAPGNSVA